MLSEQSYGPPLMEKKEMNRNKLVYPDSVIEKNPNLSSLLEELKQYDIRTYEHTFEAARLATLAARELKLDEEELELLITASLVHDLGKIKKVDKKILLKEEKLNEDDWEELKKHVNNEVFHFLKKEAGMEAANIAIRHHDHNGESKCKSSRGNLDRRKVCYLDLENSDHRNSSDRREFDARTYRLSRILNIIDAFHGAIDDRLYKKRKENPKDCIKKLGEIFTENEDKKVLDALNKEYVYDNVDISEAV